MVTHARYSDDLHVVGLAPELRWVLSPTLRIVFSPALNWVTSRGDVRYAWGTPLVYPAQPQVRHRDDGLTLGGGIGVDWTVAPDWALSLSYHYTDLDPSFGRQANVFSGGLKWSF